MKPWLRRVISGILTLLVFAGTYPNVIVVRHGVADISGVGLAVVLVFAFIPFLLVCIFAGRRQILEHIGWGGHFIALAAASFR